LPSLSVATGRRLGGLFLAYLAAAVTLITLAPFQFARPAAFSVSWVVLDGGWATDVVLNVVLFVPLGVLWQRMTGDAPVRVLAVALLAGFAIEGAQLFLAPRYTTASDLVANGTGGWLGASLSVMLARRVDSTTLVSRLWLDQPLMGLVALLIPLAWLLGLSSTSDPTRIWLLSPIGACAALAIAAVAVGAAPTVGGTGPMAPLVAGVLWVGVAMVPSLRVEPRLALVAGAGTLFVAWGGRHLWRVALQRDRRLEPQVVRALLPLMLLTLAGLSHGAGSITLRGGGEAAREGLLRTLASFAAFTLLGYLIAEYRGRRRESLGLLLIWPALIAVGVAVILAVTQRAPLNGIVGVVASATASAVGAALYDAQRAHILALLAER
jgi:glycopeptide antibiotics resistance protein